MKTLIKVDLDATPESQDYLHNRWHPDIPMVAMVNQGDEFRVECIDWTGGQIKNNDDARAPASRPSPLAARALSSSSMPGSQRG